MLALAERHGIEFTGYPGPDSTVGAHGPSARIASPAPGQGGIVAPIARSGSSPSARNWNVVPSGMSMLTPGPTSTVSSSSPVERHICPRPDRKNHTSSTVRWRTATEISPAPSSKWAIPPPLTPSSTRTLEPSGAIASGSAGSVFVCMTEDIVCSAMAQVAEQIVGRASELRSIDAALGELERGRPVALELEGEPGIGKTRLLAELGRIADERGCLVLSGSASELEHELPFWVFVDALDEYVRGLPPACWRR